MNISVDQPPAISLTMAQAANVVGFSLSNIKSRVLSGDLPSIKIGRRRVILVEDLHAWLRRYRAAVAEA